MSCCESTLDNKREALIVDGAKLARLITLCGKHDLVQLDLAEGACDHPAIPWSVPHSREFERACLEGFRFGANRLSSGVLSAMAQGKRLPWKFISILTTGRIKVIVYQGNEDCQLEDETSSIMSSN